MADPRLEQIAADAAARGWEVRWEETDHRVELLIVPTISNSWQQGMLGFTVGVRLGSGTLACWIWESWSSTLIEPWIDDDDDPGIGDESLFPTVANLEDCCRLFDRAALRFLALMRRITLSWRDPGSIRDWADLEPLSQMEAV